MSREHEAGGVLDTEHVIDSQLIMRCVGREVAQLTECLPCVHGALGLIASPRKLTVVGYAYNPSI